jgi:hypothetical protein
MNAPRSGCPINLTLEALGDRWSLIVIRDLSGGNRGPNPPIEYAFYAASRMSQLRKSSSAASQIHKLRAS